MIKVCKFIVSIVGFPELVLQQTQRRIHFVSSAYQAEHFKMGKKQKTKFKKLDPTDPKFFSLNEPPSEPRVSESAGRRPYRDQQKGYNRQEFGGNDGGGSSDWRRDRNQSEMNFNSDDVEIRRKEPRSREMSRDSYEGGNNSSWPKPLQTSSDDSSNWRESSSSSKRHHQWDSKVSSSTSSYGNDRKYPSRDATYDDEEWTEFNNDWINKKIEYVKVKEVEQDLFKVPREYSLAHCVAEDMNMGSGIAVEFRKKFGNVAKLLNQRQQTGGLAFLENTELDRYIYYLVTKGRSQWKPKFQDFFKSLKMMRDHVVENKITKLAMPQIGCGLDGLYWEEVKSLIEFMFRNVENIEILVCLLGKEEVPKKTYIEKCFISRAETEITEIKSDTVVICFLTEDGKCLTRLDGLEKKFNFKGFSSDDDEKVLGKTIFSYNHSHNILFCGCVVKSKLYENFDFEKFAECLKPIQQKIEEKSFALVAFQKPRQRDDPALSEKIGNIMRHDLSNVEITCYEGAPTYNDVHRAKR